VDEMACLIDFGIAEDTVLSSLPLLNTVRQLSNTPQRVAATVPEQIERHAVTHLQCTPSRASMLLLEPGATTALQRLQKLLLGGEALPSTLAAQLREITEAALHNMYGPTETTIWSTTEQVTQTDGTIPIGRPIANTQIYVLDGRLQPVAVGVPGRLYIGGAGLARGYLHRPDLTAERFVPDPFTKEGGARLYWTGDLARYRADGTLEYLGRADYQVKLRGFRIELGEIESALAQHPQVREAIVMARQDMPPVNEHPDMRLVAYVIEQGNKEQSNKEEQALTIDELRRFLRDRLPDYMIPSAFVLLESLPLTPNGKVDRKALPAPDAARPELEDLFVAPRTALEAVIAKMWAKVLGVERIGVHDNFFLLGGHSLLAIKMASQIGKTFQTELPVRHFFEHSTVAALAELLIAKEKQPGQTEKIAQLIQRIKTDSPENLRKALEQKRKERNNA
jgi:acyl-coenzyme A synthetase/AMP-(fatty) acid ligase/acyl carrier protein